MLLISHWELLLGGFSPDTIGSFLVPQHGAVGGAVGVVVVFSSVYSPLPRSWGCSRPLLWTRVPLLEMNPQLIQFPEVCITENAVR